MGYRPARASRFDRVVDISAGGMRVFAPECLEAGERLPLEIRMPDGASIELWAEVAPFFEALGLETVRLLASQGILYLLQEQVAELHERDPAAYQALLDIAAGAATDPSILGLSGHLLYAGRA